MRKTSWFSLPDLLSQCGPRRMAWIRTALPVFWQSRVSTLSSPFSILYWCHISLALCHLRLKKTRKRHLSHGLDSNDLMDRAVEPANLWHWNTTYFSCWLFAYVIWVVKRNSHPGCQQEERTEKSDLFASRSGKVSLPSLPCQVVVADCFPVT